jgi:hypothetical protein
MPPLARYRQPGTINARPVRDTASRLNRCRGELTTADGDLGLTGTGVWVLLNTYEERFVSVAR